MKLQGDFRCSLSQRDGFHVRNPPEPFRRVIRIREPAFTSYHYSDNLNGFELTQIPEPSTVFLLDSPLFCVAADNPARINRRFQ